MSVSVRRAGNEIFIIKQPLQIIPKEQCKYDLGLNLIIITRVVKVVTLQNKQTNQISQTRKLEDQRTKEISSKENKENINLTT
jgi:hypothetical protein